jgi:hypothetical protein
VNHFIRLCAFALIAAGCATAGSTPRFGAHDLPGFYVYVRDRPVNQDPDQVFTVSDGVLHASGKQFGYVATVQEYENYRLTLQYRWGTETWEPRKGKARDSGLLFHMTGPDKVWPHSIEFQIIEGGTGDVLLVDGASMAFDEELRPRLSAGAKPTADGRLDHGRVNWEGRSPEWKDVFGFRGARDLEKPAGEWNTLDLVVDHDTFEYTVNGTVVMKGRGAQPQKGRIVLQSEGAEVFFRNFALRPLAH